MLNLLNVTCLNCIQHTQSGINPSSLTAILKTKIPAKCVCRVPVREPVLLFAWPFIKVNHPWSSLDWWLLTNLSCRLIREPVNKQLTGLISILICRLLPPCVHVLSIFFNILFHHIKHIFRSPHIHDDFSQEWVTFCKSIAMFDFRTWLDSWMTLHEQKR